MTTAKKAADVKKATRRRRPAPPPQVRVPYEERWQAFSDEEKHKVADGHVAEIDELVRQLTDPDTPISLDALAEMAALEAVKLDSLTERIESMKAHLDRLIQARTVTYAKMVLAGEPLSAVARRSKVTTMVVSFALGISTRSR